MYSLLTTAVALGSPIFIGASMAARKVPLANNPKARAVAVRFALTETVIGASVGVQFEVSEACRH